MKEFYPVLHRCPLFADIGREELPALIECLGAQLRTYQKNATILAEGDPARYIGVVLKGSAQVLQVDYEGNRTIVGGVEPTDIFGEAFACAGAAALPVSVAANEPCTVLLIDSRRITATCQKACAFHHKIIFNLMRELAVKNLRFHQKLEVTSRRTTREKLMTYLAHEARRAGSRSFDIPFDRQALADYLEVDRSGLSSQIGKLVKEGVLTANKRHFELM